jgi:hypothetical protein
MSIRNKVFAFIGFLGALDLVFFLRPRGIPPLVDFVPLHTSSPEWDAVDIGNGYGDGE